MLHPPAIQLPLANPLAARSPLRVRRRCRPQKFQAYFLNKWTPGALAKPVDREAQRIHSWIQAVYQDRRFFAEPPGGFRPASSTASEVRQAVPGGWAAGAVAP